MSARISIAIPTLNRAQLLDRAIQSALAQCYDDVEIIASDNGSIDDTKNVLSKYTGRIKTFTHTNTMSAARHGEFICKQATGELLLCLSDDDWLEPDFCAEIARLFSEYPAIAFGYTGCVNHYDGRKVPSLVGPRVENGLDFLFAYYSGHREICWCACVVPRKLFLEIPPQPDNRIIGDMYFWTKLACRGPVGCVSRSLSNYTALRSDGDNISRLTPARTWGEEVRILADEAIQSARISGANQRFLDKMDKETKRYVARSTANQFLWNKIKGFSTVDLIRNLPGCITLLGHSAQALLRVFAAIVLPRHVLRSLVLEQAARVGKRRVSYETKASAASAS
jgi:glycosyltransferase involved in cell wall biosynthesis